MPYEKLIHNSDAPIVVPVSMTAHWKEVEAATPEVQDNSGNFVTDPDTDLADGWETRIFTRDNKAGTLISARLFRDKDATVSADAVGVLHGRASSGEAWQPLYNVNGDLEVTFTTSANDPIKGERKYTIPDPNTHAWDCQGCNEFFFHWKTAQALSGGGHDDGGLEVKGI